MASAAAASAILLAGSLSAHAQQDPRPDFARPRPPLYEAIELEMLDSPPGYEFQYWMPWSVSDDGTVYGYMTDIELHRMFVSRPNVGTRWLLRDEPDIVEAQPIAASTSGVTLIFTWLDPEDWVYIPNQGVREIESLHESDFNATDMNNHHVVSGLVGHGDLARPVLYDPNQGFIYLDDFRAAAWQVNDLNTAVGWIGETSEEVYMRVWYANGDKSDFTVPRWPDIHVSIDGINNRNEIVGYHRRGDETWSRFGGWYWSEETGFLEIPFLHEGSTEDSHVFIWDISDDGWVLGNQPYRNDEGDAVGDWFLWHVDGGFHRLGDLFDWEETYFYPGDRSGWGAMNASGQIAIETRRRSDNKAVCVFLDPIR